MRRVDAVNSTRVFAGQNAAAPTAARVRDTNQTWAFLAKIAFIVLAGANALWFYVSGLHRRLAAVEAGQDAPMAAKLVAAGSLVLWFGVMFWGRMLPSFSKAF